LYTALVSLTAYFSSLRMLLLCIHKLPCNQLLADIFTFCYYLSCKTTAATTILWPLYESTCISRHPTLVKNWRILLEQNFTACMPCQQHPVHPDEGKRR